MADQPRLAAFWLSMTQDCILKKRRNGQGFVLVGEGFAAGQHAIGCLSGKLFVTNCSTDMVRGRALLPVSTCQAPKMTEEFSERLGGAHATLSEDDRLQAEPVRAAWSSAGTLLFHHSTCRYFRSAGLAAIGGETMSLALYASPPPLNIAFDRQQSTTNVPNRATHNLFRCCDNVRIFPSNRLVFLQP
jgi:hypothetical protein